MPFVNYLKDNYCESCGRSFRKGSCPREQSEKTHREKCPFDGTILRISGKRSKREFKDAAWKEYDRILDEVKSKVIRELREDGLV